MGNVLVVHLQNHFNVSFRMLRNHIEACPDILWDKRHGGFIFYQQLIHAFEGVLYWMRDSAEYHGESVINPLLHAEMERDPEIALSKTEAASIADNAMKQATAFLSGRSDQWLYESCAVDSKMLNVDIIEGQIRHVQYHVGHCNSILREQGHKAVDWLGYLENTDGAI